ncbi:MAG: ABC-2 family transporter protein [Alphaproteobacteria bacterium]
MTMLRQLRIYAALGLSAFRHQFHSPAYILSRVVTYIFFTWIFAEFWRFVLSTRGDAVAFGFTHHDIVWYMGVAQLVLFASTRMFLRIDDDVRSGNIAYTLTRPVNYIALRLAEGVGATCASLLLFLPLGFVFCLLYTGVMPQGSLWFCALLCALASFIHMLFQVMIGFAALWLYDIQPLYRLYQKLMLVLGGVYFPITLYPDWLQQLSWATPFGLLLARPADSIYLSDPYLLWSGFWLMLGWLCVLLVLALMVYGRVQRHIDLHGG